MPRALPPASDHAPRALAIVARKVDVDEALAEQIRAHKLHADTAEALQRRINTLIDIKARRAKTLAAAVRRTEDDLATAVIGDQFAQLVDAVKRVTTSYEVGATPAPADVKLIMAHSVESRAKFMAWQSALKTKKKEASRFKDRIEEVREALSKLLLRGTEKPEDTAQTTIPGIDAEPPEPQGWANETTKRVIIETFAHEVKRADHEAQRAASTGDDVAERVARARAAERQNLIEELRLAGFTAEPSTGDDDITVMELDFDLATDEEVAVDDEDDEPEESEECPTDADADVAPEPEPEPEDPTKHPALAGAISATKAKRAEKKADAKPKGRGRGGKK